MSIQAVDDNSGLLQRVKAVDGNLRIANLVWDPTTLAWVKQTQSVSGGTATDVNILNTSVPVSQAGTWNFAPPMYALAYDQVDATLAYLGHAAVGSSQGGSVWRIQKLVFGADGDVTITYADGNVNFDNVWTDRASLSYS